MNKKQSAGCAIFALCMIGIFASTVETFGWMSAIKNWSVAFVVTALIGLGVHLMSDGGWP